MTKKRAPEGLYGHLRSTGFAFLGKGEHDISDIYTGVKRRFPSLCDNRYLCSENCGSGHPQQPEWKHKTRSALNDLTKLKVVVSGRRRGLWVIGVSDALEDPKAILDEKEEARIHEAEIPETEKEQLVKARRGQGIFRVRVEGIETACRLTEVKDKRFLIASHIKPWRASDNVEKLDGSNGLLLSPHVDKLFDKGWISFSDDGKVLCDNEDIRRLMIWWGLNPDKNVGVFNSEQRKYLAYHREKSYKA